MKFIQDLSLPEAYRVNGSIVKLVLLRERESETYLKVYLVKALLPHMWLPRQNHAIKWPQPCVTILRQFFTQTFDFFFVHFNFCRILLRDVPHPVWMHGSNTLKRTSSSASSWSSNCESVPKKKSQHSSRHRLRCIDDFVHSLKSHFNWKSFFNCYFYSNPNSTFIFTWIPLLFLHEFKANRLSWMKLQFSFGWMKTISHQCDDDIRRPANKAEQKISSKWVERSLSHMTNQKRVG